MGAAAFLGFMIFAAYSVIRDMHEDVAQAAIVAEARNARIAVMREQHGPCIHVRGPMYLCDEVVCELDGDCVSRSNLQVTVITGSGRNQILLESR